MISETIKTKNIGFCIYCRSTNQLSNEHIIPFGLGGQLTLKSASCEKCRKITNAFEAPMLRGLLYDYRFYKNHASRTKLIDYDPFRKYLIITKAGKKESRSLHLNQTGLHFALPEFEEPKFLSGDKGVGVKIKRMATFTANPKLKNVPKDISSIQIKRVIPTGHLIRLLCKVGLGCAYLQGYDDGLESYVDNLILGHSGNEDWRYVGSPVFSTFEDEEAGIKLYEKDGILLAEIKLFEDLLARYLVVIGKRKI